MKKITYPLISLLIGAVLTGVIFSILVNAWYSTFATPVERAARFLKPINHLGWIQKPNLNTEFEGELLLTNPDGFRSNRTTPKFTKLLFLGPSSTFGWGVAAQNTYAAQTAKLLETDFLNAGQIGYSSYQGLQLIKLSALKNIKPSIVIISYGINDIDRNRFFFQNSDQDKNILNKPIESKLISIAQIQTFLPIHSLSHYLLKPFAMNSCFGLKEYIPKLRVTFEDTLSNFKQLVSWAQSRGSKVVLMTSPTTYLSQSLFQPIDNSEVYLQANKALTEGNCKEAQDIRQKAILGEPNRIANDTRKLNKQIRAYAEENGLLLVDAEKLLTPDSKELFVDPVHPSTEGHRKIALALARKLKDTLRHNE